MSDGVSRRRVLGGLAVAAGVGLAGWQLTADSPDRPAVTQPDEETSRSLAERFAPELNLGVGERWVPVDPGQYASDRDGDRIVDGFDAFDGYARAVAEEAVEPTVFYRVVRYEATELAVVQYWLYSAFDQFSVNFHWHDWELLQVFLDVSGGGAAGDSRQIEPSGVEPVLFVASAHSRTVPNNEYLEPEVDRPSVISEVGSHSSALGVNRTRRQFERLPVRGGSGDVTNPILSAGGLPFAYGLPRGEGTRLPYLLPELDGTPIHEHERLPNVDRTDLVPERFTVGAFTDLSEPPTGLPEREHDRTLRFESATPVTTTPGAESNETTGEGSTETAGEGSTETAGGSRTETTDQLAGVGTTYRLRPITTVSSIDRFTGPQLSFPFAVPEFGEDVVSSHITTAGQPWDQPRYTDPIVDVTDPRHLAALADRFDVPQPTGATALVARLKQAVSSDDAPGSNGIETTVPDTGGVALLESDPVAVPTVGDSVVILDPPPGDHRLTVNAPGLAPYSERLRHQPNTESPEQNTQATTEQAARTTEQGTRATNERNTQATEQNTQTTAEQTTQTDSPESDPTEADGSASATATTLAGVTTAGAGGQITVPANAAAVKLRLAGDDTLQRVELTDDFAGRVYDGQPDEDGRDAVYAHRAGAYTADVRDADGEPGAYRINPASDQETATVERVETGKRSMAAYLETFLRETTAQARAIADGRDVDSAVPADARDPDEGDRQSETTTDSEESGDTESGNTDSGDTESDNTESDDEGTTDTGQPSGLDVVLGRLENALEAAQRALQAANRGGGGETDRRLRGLSNQLDAIRRTVDSGPGDLPDPLVAVLDRRLRLLARRVSRAIAADTV